MVESNRALWRYWQILAGNYGVPRKSAVNPLDIPSLLANLFILEWQNDDSPVFRLAGTGVCSRSGGELTGKRLLDLYDGNDRDALSDALNEQRQRSHGVVRWRLVEDMFGRDGILEGVYLPLKDEAGNVSYILGSTVPLNMADKRINNMIVDCDRQDRPFSVQRFDPRLPEDHLPVSIGDPNILRRQAVSQSVDKVLSR